MVEIVKHLSDWAYWRKKVIRGNYILQRSEELRLYKLF